MCLAVPGKVIEVVGDDPLTASARVDFAGSARAVSLALVPEAGAGDYVLVHAGFAITRVDEGEARRTLAAIAALEEIPPDETAGDDVLTEGSVDATDAHGDTGGAPA